jgi:alpha-galactosidase
MKQLEQPTSLILRHACLPSLLLLLCSSLSAADPATPAKRERLTPPVPATPRINGAPVFGVRPGHPVLFTIPASGERPMTFAAQGLPAGLTFDATTGRIAGAIATPGTHEITLTAKNAKGSAERKLRVVVGEDIALTPPMGWNSWYCQSEGVNQKAITAMAEAMVASGLVHHGWTYINMDDCWQGARTGPGKALAANEKFPDMKAMCDRVHALGLKVGLYSTPWMGSYAGFRGGSCDNAEGNYDHKALPADKRLQPPQIFGRYPGFRKAGMGMVGPHWFCDADAKQWAAWGVDYVKYDWGNNDIPTTERIAKGLRACGRDIILSLSNAAPFARALGLSKLAQLWRTTGDIHESWKSIRDIGFKQDKWSPFASPGHWNDPDMLQIGMLGQPNRAETVFRPSKLTPDEQYTQVSLWCLLAAPLILSCDLTQLDDFTLGLITNDEVLAIDQDPLGKHGVHVAGPDQGDVIAKPLEGGDWAVGLFNRGDQEQEVTIRFADLKLTGRHKVRDLWRQKDCGTSDEAFSAKVAAHGVMLVRISKPT